MATYGYARCSTSEDKQDINRQVRELKATGAEEVIFEYEHGDAKVKKELHMLLEMVEPGDTIITLEVSRLSRSTQQLCEIIDTIREKHLRLVSVGSITIDCRNGQTDPMAEGCFQLPKNLFQKLPSNHRIEAYFFSPRSRASLEIISSVIRRAVLTS